MNKISVRCRGDRVFEFKPTSTALLMVDIRAGYCQVTGAGRSDLSVLQRLLCCRIPAFAGVTDLSKRH
jgi:hypothetical protein